MPTRSWSGRCAEHNQALEKRLRAMSDQLSQLERDTADRLTQEAQSLREEIKGKR